MGASSIGTFKFTGNNLPCSQQLINTQLSSPVESVIEKISIGDVLSVETIDKGRILVAIYNDEVAGVIVNKEILKIIDCLKKGFKFQAIVRNVLGGRCAVTIRSINLLDKNE